MSLAKMCAGCGVDYMLRNVARGDGAGRGADSLPAYYTASGYPPGIWLGSGLAGLADGRGITPGALVDERGMRLLFGDGSDPATGAPLGRGAAQRVVGFDLTFSVPKSASVLWGISNPEIKAAIVKAHHDAIVATLRIIERDVARTRVGAGGATQVPVQGIVAAAFDHFDSRDADPQLHTHVTVANRVQAADGQWRTLYGARLYRAAVAMSEIYDALFADAITRSLGMDWEWRQRGASRNPARQLAAVPQELVDEFSTRARAIDAAKDRALDSFTAKYGREPTAAEVIRIRQQATLTTRQAKHVKSLAEHTAAWQARATRLLGTPAEAWAAQRIRNVSAAPRLGRADHVTPAQVEEVAAAVLDAVEAKRATWSEWNIQAETARQIAATGTHFATSGDLIAVRDRIAHAALDRSVQLNLDTADTGAQLGIRGAEPSTHRLFTSLTILAAEDRLLTAADDHTGPVATPPGRAAVIGALARVGAQPERIRGSGAALAAAIPVASEDDVSLHDSTPAPDSAQQDAVAAIVTSGRMADVLVGPAGAGKSTAMRLLRDTWQQTHGLGSVAALAPSSAAARVLGTGTGAAAETCAQWVAQQRGETRRLEKLVTLQRRRERRAEAGFTTSDLDQEIAAARVEFDRWRMKPGQLVIVDEAGMADTKTLDAIVTQARNSGAKVVLVGDPAQLGAVGAGGAFAMLVAARTDAPELTQVRRFCNPDGTPNRAEAQASKELRAGDTRALAYYRARGRIHIPGLDGSAVESAYAAWKSDRECGVDSLLIAADNATVAALNAKARGDLVAAGSVQPGGILLADGTTAGVGDRIVTRKVERHLPDGTEPRGRRTRPGALAAGYVTNSQAFTVTATTAAGDLIVKAEGGTPVMLPAAYARKHVQLGYAITAHRAQGSTVDTAHVIAASGMTREAFYVSMTRGRYANHAHIETRHPGGDIDRIDVDSSDTVDAATVLDRILAASGNPTAAHTTRDQLRRQAAATREGSRYGGPTRDAAVVRKPADAGMHPLTTGGRNAPRDLPPRSRRAVTYGIDR